MHKKHNDSHVLEVVTVGVALAGIAATAYFFLGPNGKQNQRDTKAWAVKMKADVIEQLEKAGEVTEDVYHQIIDSVAADYADKVKEGQEEAEELAKDLKKKWKTLSKEVEKNKEATTRRASRATRRALD